jgi:hypothetical protein
MANGLAYAADLVPRGSLSRAIALYSSSLWIGSIVGFSAAGLAIGALGLAPALLAAAGLPALSILLLALVRRPAPGAGPA